MRSSVKGNRYPLVTVVSACFFLCVFVFHVPLYAAGEIWAWGAGQPGQPKELFNHNYGQCIVPEPNTGFKAIAAGGIFSLGLKQDGSIVAWGDNYSGECNVPGPNTGFVAIAAGNAHSLGLKQDGSIVGWGDNGFAP